MLCSVLMHAPTEVTMNKTEEEDSDCDGEHLDANENDDISGGVLGAAVTGAPRKLTSEVCSVFLALLSNLRQNVCFVAHYGRDFWGQCLPRASG